MKMKSKDRSQEGWKLLRERYQERGLVLALGAAISAVATQATILYFCNLVFARRIFLLQTEALWPGVLNLSRGRPT